MSATPSPFTLPSWAKQRINPGAKPGSIGGGGGYGPNSRSGAWLAQYGAAAQQNQNIGGGGQLVPGGMTSSLRGGMGGSGGSGALMGGSGAPGGGMGGGAPQPSAGAGGQPAGGQDPMQQFMQMLQQAMGGGSSGPKGVGQAGFGVPAVKGGANFGGTNAGSWQPQVGGSSSYNNTGLFGQQGIRGGGAWDAHGNWLGEYGTHVLGTGIDAGSRNVGSANYAGVANVMNYLGGLPAGQQGQAAAFLRSQGLMPSYNGQYVDQLNGPQQQWNSNGVPQWTGAQTYMGTDSSGKAQYAKVGHATAANQSNADIMAAARQRSQQHTATMNAALNSGNWNNIYDQAMGKTNYAGMGNVGLDPNAMPNQNFTSVNFGTPQLFSGATGGMGGMGGAMGHGSTTGSFGSGGMGGGGGPTGLPLEEPLTSGIMGLLRNPSGLSAQQEAAARSRAVSPSGDALEVELQRAREDAARRGLSPGETEANLAAVRSQGNAAAQRASTDFDLGMAGQNRQGIGLALQGGLGMTGQQLGFNSDIMKYMAMLQAAQMGQQPAFLDSF